MLLTALLGRAGRAAGIDGYLTKPPGKKELLDLLARLQQAPHAAT